MSSKHILCAALAAKSCGKVTSTSSVGVLSLSAMSGCHGGQSPAYASVAHVHSSLQRSSHCRFHHFTGLHLPYQHDAVWNRARTPSKHVWQPSKLFSSCSVSAYQVHGKCNGTSCKNKDVVPDLQRFLSEIGTDPKEARFWLKQFLNVDQKKPFAVVEIDREVFADSSLLDQLASALSFLQRNSLRPILVFGDVCDNSTSNPLMQQSQKSASVDKCCALSDSLKEQGLESCILFAGSGVIQTQQQGGATVKMVNADLIQWCMMRQVIPIIPSFAETPAGHIVQLPMWEVTSAVARQLQPLKVIKVNSHGGFQNENGQIIANVNLPFDFQAAKDRGWCTKPVMQTIDEVSSLLTCLPEQTSVVITAADKVLQELFTHHGCGTFLKMTEPILKYHSFNSVDIERLKTLLSKSFQKPLSDTYFNDIRNQVHTIFISECYTAAAVILQIEGCDVPYLCKFAVSAQAQGEGTGELLWDVIQRDFRCLFWRSRRNNHINPWYFRKSEGSWNVNNNWTVFWYGITELIDFPTLVQRAVNTPDSFTEPAALVSKQTPSAI